MEQLGRVRSATVFCRDAQSRMCDCGSCPVWLAASAAALRRAWKARALGGGRLAVVVSRTSWLPGLLRRVASESLGRAPPVFICQKYAHCVGTGVGSDAKEPVIAPRWAELASVGAPSFPGLSKRQQLPPGTVAAGLGHSDSP